MNDIKLNHALEERSYVDFYFSNLDSPLGTKGVRRIPFFENPEITESRSPSYAKTPIVQRNEPARLYVGSDVRKVGVKFYITLPHVVEFIEQSNEMPGWSREIINDYKQYIVLHSSKTFGVYYHHEGPAIKEDSPGSETNVEWLFRDLGPRFDGASRSERLKVLGAREPGVVNSLLTSYGNSTDDVTVKTAAFIQYVIDTVKSSVIGNQNSVIGDSAYGPPLARLRHGVAFTEEPFIVTGYNIDFDNTAGTDPRTLLPRRLNIRLQLEEFRQVNGVSENLPGYSYVLDLKNSDRKRYLGEV